MQIVTTNVGCASAAAAAADDDDDEENTFVGCGNVFCSSELLPPDIREMLHLIKKIFNRCSFRLLPCRQLNGTVAIFSGSMHKHSQMQSEKDLTQIKHFVQSHLLAPGDEICCINAHASTSPFLAAIGDAASLEKSIFN